MIQIAFSAKLKHFTEKKETSEVRQISHPLDQSYILKEMQARDDRKTDYY